MKRDMRALTILKRKTHQFSFNWRQGSSIFLWAELCYLKNDMLSFVNINNKEAGCFASLISHMCRHLSVSVFQKNDKSRDIQGAFPLTCLMHNLKLQTKKQVVKKKISQISQKSVNAPIRWFFR